MTSAEWAVVIGAVVGSYAFIIGVLKVLMDAIGKERQERQSEMAKHEERDEMRRDKVLVKLDELQKGLSEKIDDWAERVGTRLGDHNQRITRLETKAER